MKYNFSKITKKVMDRFFRVINKLGSMVTLDRDLVIKIDPKTGKKVDGRPTLSSLVRKLGFRVYGACFGRPGSYLLRIRQLQRFANYLNIMSRRHGSAYTVGYLKVGMLAIQKAIASNPAGSLNELDPKVPYPYLASCGLPKIIPTRDRNLMLINKSTTVMRWWLSLFALYRVISIPGKLKLETITAPMTVTDESVMEVLVGIKKLIQPGMFHLQDLTEGHKGIIPTFIMKASASSSVSWTGWIADVYNLVRHGMFDTLIEYNNLIGHYDRSRFLLYLAKALFSDELVNQFGITSLVYKQFFTHGPIGQLKTKEEPAGKIRVFAMVDFWTQMSLESLHTMLFNVFRRLPNDGTFDQRAAVRRCLTKCQLTGKSFGYDLSAATDRLPLSLQIGILNHLFPRLGDLWGRLLVNRDYHLSLTKDRSFKGSPDMDINIRYAVGQPMGALSSWAMLNITHHLVAQLAYQNAFQSGFSTSKFYLEGAVDIRVFGLDNWYVGYEVLGDDIVFFEEPVALEYLKLASALGVDINLAKSVIANNPTFEFAKVTGHNGTDVSAVSWASFMSQPSIMGRASIAFSLLGRPMFKSHHVGWLRNLSRQSKYTVGESNVFFLALGTMYSKAGRIPYYDFLYSIMQKSMGHFNVYQTLLEKSNIGTLEIAIGELAKSVDSKVTIKNPMTKVPDLSKLSPMEQLMKMRGSGMGKREEEFRIKQTLATIIMNRIHGYRLSPDGPPIMGINAFDDAKRLTRDLLTGDWQLLTLGQESLIKLEKLSQNKRECLLALQQKDEPLAVTERHAKFEKAFSLTYREAGSISPLGFISTLYSVLFLQVYDKLARLESDIQKYDGVNLHDFTLDELIKVVDLLDRYSEIMNLRAKTESKLAHEEVPDRNLLESPLKSLVLLLKADDPFGPRKWAAPAWFRGSDPLDHLAALSTLDKLPNFDSLQLGDIDPKGFYLSLFRPIGRPK